MAASSISVSCEECVLLGRMEKELRVEWSVAASHVNLIDWIGMYEVDEHNPLHYIDYKSYGVCGAPMGSVSWRLYASQFTYSNSDELSVCFRIWWWWSLKDAGGQVAIIGRRWMSLGRYVSRSFFRLFYIILRFLYGL
uniref:HECW_N domain-containing protein n=1 Tax=Steinernema glaseri TaxID=37863 RepID=A0A1I8AKT5_9BILA